MLIVGKGNRCSGVKINHLCREVELIEAAGF